ncbi:DNA-processing protein DprA [Prauserella muralis]|uniref:DNA processing protein DprA n=1 Tax=Prauserella muralis TaxID=588067 RepID=A0A2V4BF85_9PSEU|nr:DNA-processing protein DprA [Prauserella muralis]PXY28259.1 DNA processing protein DprA [Prauserella muralis]TWE27427.1 DNA processing protein [Prauserella muralis]
MDRVTEQAALLALLWDRRSGWSAAADAVEACGSAYDVLTNGEPGTQGELFGREPAEALEAARLAIAEWAAEGIRLVTLLDEDYPGQLLTIHQRPPFLLYRGTLDQRDVGGVAVVGTRQPSAEGACRAAEIARGLARRGVPVISGLAAGIDTAAHRGALEVGGRTVAVIGTGLHRTYPPENADLQAELGRSHLVLSQFWPNSAPSKTSFPMRNAVMSGYAAATVVIEAAWRSGARMQARLALQHGRPVFLLDSLLQHDWAREYAKQPGTRIVSGPEDVLEQLADVLAPPQELVWT